MARQTAGPSLKILFLCTAHNSLSQRLSLVLQERGHHVTVELAISPDLMIEAAKLAGPDLIVCPFLTKKVPAEVYESYLTWIIHPGAPGDAGPSAIDWVLLGDDGTEADSQKALEKISTNQYVASGQGRSHWGVTVLQAIEEFDAGPVWAWEQFPITLDGPTALTKASLYRGPLTTAAVAACLCAIDRLLAVAPIPSFPSINPSLPTESLWASKSATTQQEFLGGKTHTRPLLQPAQRAWNPETDSAALVSRRLRASDSQPGVQSPLLYGKKLYLYGGLIEENPIPFKAPRAGQIAAQRDGAVLVLTADGKGVWITHVRRLKPKNQALLPAKLPALLGLKSVPELANEVDFEAIPTWNLAGFVKVPGTFQEVWIEYDSFYGAFQTAYIYSNFYNGAASTAQCQQLLAAIKEVISQSSVKALVLMGGDYWNNGIHLGVCSTDAAQESWKNINAINDCVEALLSARDIVTFAAIRGNAAAGGFALATCCDFVFCVENAVINPHYRAVGLYGSEYHTLTWYARAGEEVAKKFTRGILPMSATTAVQLGLIDQVINAGASVAQHIKSAVMRTLFSDADQPFNGAPWTKPRLHPSRHSPDPRRLMDAVPLRRQAWLDCLPQPLASYRNQELDFMKLNFTDPRYERCVQDFTGKAAATSTPLRFALHRRFTHWEKPLLDPEEDADYFDYPLIDAEAVHSALGISPSQPIELIYPPTQRDGQSLFLGPALSLENNPTKSPNVSPSFSESTTLNNSLQLTPQGSNSSSNDTPLMPHNNSPCTPASPRPASNEYDAKASHRISRVVQKLRAVLVQKTDQITPHYDDKFQQRSPATKRRTTFSISGKPASRDHQMSCYYGTVDAERTLD
ncbi:hypothetical protein PTTG_07219 [Puccinia triticina 1-1 BBBD Race 1]|uniref:Formyl transferase C-terminal domain-containing protein n=2 Tax=Puccinia triticina TaxID=208348 RepID=A0A0C4F298_PUCT1|nr:uncharacterized protein PtA15_9A696 [Puccinia triticina]OAV97352.1 hypothetical protein PTTG_07219 [Puccinia triticina 1-1 BBBD Race 1]WAQ88569.1 hypothetical protein PtA15_9A696 [Puccinia triticina]